MKLPMKTFRKVIKNLEQNLKEIHNDTKVKQVLSEKEVENISGGKNIDLGILYFMSSLFGTPIRYLNSKVLKRKKRKGKMVREKLSSYKEHRPYGRCSFGLNLII